MKKKFKILGVCILLSFILSIFMVQMIGKKLNKTIVEYSTIEAKRFSNYVVHKALDKEFISNLDTDIFTTKKNSNNEIEMVDFKSKKANELLENVTRKVQKSLINLENGDIEEFNLSNSFYGLSFLDRKKGVVCEIPSGSIYGNLFLSNLGPVIPIRFTFIGEVEANLKTKVKTYGINSVYLEVYINVVVNQRISMPLRTDEVKSSLNIPLTIKIIQGSIPNYYQNQIIGDSSMFSLPIK